ncbi:oxepin-CoA hydrolase / 3-oxo-5,6-dehydrosuberyl-CoA semialdehyde dehydrogenase [Filimonas lacunae]|uniref:Oxepin-CoA hydrolase / 3-oxo-5,6-dehydrosuberyl-CoA semialdehyde dehydrogenase n=1 Tax=Filimonas lacunae TaxID=477680 RepID=A0A173MPZ5_9BACT|nr:phenylacetic acid degradation bifunctional protein PaaZ [Filimonas lacunae]BAV09566.1 phenylacetic acid degradation protein PaaN, ring-opening aldehyde dehydrogenase [Filimonas lacunae]SIS75324.1 oxepin-CoA hydrolase / 3-oxo-5,6-dehydrosuberyl-CoA semialdehyde dehydrogenase [Filimonas lacunae]
MTVQSHLENYVTGQWLKGDGNGQPLYDATTGSVITHASAQGLDFAQILHYGRETGGHALRKMTFQERGLMLRALALHLRNHLDKFYQISYLTGATRADSWIDIEGGIGNLFAYASLRRKFPNQPFCLDGDGHVLGKEGSFMGQHLLLPKEGVAIHINAFNFPVWGMLEKIAVNLLAGVPAVVKPATLTSFLTEAVVREIDASGILPKGALQLICGSAGDMLSHVNSQDIVTFTGSASTGLMLKSSPAILSNSVPFTMEADSLNCMILGEDVTPDMPEWDLFIKEVRKEMTVKTGQKCTAVRRIFVPENKIEAVQQSLAKALAQTTIGNPQHEKVRMGPLAGKAQQEEVKSQVQKLLASSQIIYGSLDSVELIDADAGKGSFISPLLLLNSKPLHSKEVHEVEAFGPVATLMPYTDTEQAIALARMGKGSLVSSIVTASTHVARDYVLGAGAYHGRILVLNRDCAKENTGHGSPLPLLVHGGPGRAGGGEEMGGVRGVKHYMQRVAVQGSPSMLTAIGQVYQPGAQQTEDLVHPFRKHFEELTVGETLFTGKRTITEADISNFANLSWDHFYAHVDHTSLNGTLFERPVAHGYFILSAAAGLFVDGKKGPVLLNYGIDELRFVKPVYAGNTIGVKLTVKEKILQEKKGTDDIAKGIVKWYVEVYDETNDTVAIATILTMVKKRDDQ